VNTLLSSFEPELRPGPAASISDNLKKAGWSLGWVSALDREGRTIWIVDAHRDDGKRYIVRADEKLTAFLELESAISAAHAKKAFGGQKGAGSESASKPARWI
jgi:hypothetical protein